MFRFNKDDLRIVGVLWIIWGNMEIFGPLRLLHVIIVFVNLLLYCVESVIKSVVL